MNSNPSKSWTATFVCYAVFTFLLLAPSMTLWFHEPFNLLKHDWDIACGMLGKLGRSFGSTAMLLRAAEVALFLIIGISFYLLATRFADAIERSSWKRVLWASGIILLIHCAALPWRNPDLFYYIGTAWLDFEHGFDPYIYPKTAARVNLSRDPMFLNIDPALWWTTGNYGPLHNTLCVLVVALSGGSIKLAVLGYKLLNLLFIAGSAAVIYGIARKYSDRPKHIVFCYLCNPLIPLVFLAWVHNDIQQNLFFLLGVYCVYRKQPFFSGAAFGAALCVKYVAIVMLPALLIYWWRTEPRRLRTVATTLLGFIVVIVICYASYGNGLATNLKIYSGSWSPQRSSICSLYLAMNPNIPWWDYTPGLRRILQLIYFLLGAALTFRLLLRRTIGPEDFVKVSLWIFTFYFLVAAPTVTEWYLTWSLGCALLLPTHRRYFIVLTSFYMILVPLTAYAPHPIVVGSNVLHYLFFAYCALFCAPFVADFFWKKTPIVDDSLKAG